MGSLVWIQNGDVCGGGGGRDFVLHVHRDIGIRKDENRPGIEEPC